MPHTVEFWDDDVSRSSQSPASAQAQRDPPPPRHSYYPHDHPYGASAFAPYAPPPPVDYRYDPLARMWRYYSQPAHCGYYYHEGPQPVDRTTPAPFRPPESPPRRGPVQPLTMLNAKFESTELVYEVRDHDVLCGRGAPTSWHPGNQFFRLLIDKYQGPYLAAKRMDKPEIAMQLVALVRERGGRFLKRTKVVSSARNSVSASRGHFAWQDIGEQRAYEKACQALREGAPEIRRHMAAKEIAALKHAETRNDKDSTTTDEDEHDVRSELGQCDG